MAWYFQWERAMSKKTTDAEEKEIVELYRVGETTKGIAGKYGISDTCVRSILRRQGVVPSRRRPLSTDQHALIFELFQAGKRTREIAAEVGTSNGTVSKALREVFGVQKRPSTKRRKLSLSQRKELAQRYKAGETYQDLATAYSISTNTVGVIVKEQGIEPRTGWLKYRTTLWEDRKGRSHVFKSTWEQAYAQYLDEHGLTWEYEPRKFGLKKCRCYTPDFAVETPDGTMYIEVHGWLDDLTKNRILEFRKMYPELLFDMLGPGELADLGLVEHWYKGHAQAQKVTRFRSTQLSLLARECAD
jgi:DNA invertase Pin-like site-specific DNA recombinase